MLWNELYIKVQILPLNLNDCLLSELHISQKKLVYSTGAICTAHVVSIIRSTVVKRSPLCRVLMTD